MKKLLLATGLVASLLCGAGCSSAGTPSPSPTKPQGSAALNAPATFSVGETITFQDGVSIKLTTINDSRCKPGVQCIWAGELAPVFLFTDTDGTSQEFTLGTLRTQQATVKKHVISLTSATTEQATITVSKI